MAKSFQFLIGTFIVLVIGAFWFRKFFREAGSLIVTTYKSEYKIDDILELKIENNLRKRVCFSSCYPYYLERKIGDWKAYPYGECQRTDLVINCIKPKEIKAFQIDDFSYAKEGLHRLSIPVCIGCKLADPFKEEKRFYSNEFWIRERKEVDETADWKT